MDAIYFDEKAIILTVVVIYIIMMLAIKFLFKKDFLFLVLSTLAYGYIVMVVYYTIFPIYIPDFYAKQEMGGFSYSYNVNLLPFKGLADFDWKDNLMSMILNVIMCIPFGFLVPLLTSFKFKGTVLATLIFSVTIELIQLFSGLIIDFSERRADVNDIISNTIGGIIGYFLFVLFIEIIKRHCPHQKPYILEFLCNKRSDTQR